MIQPICQGAVFTFANHSSFHRPTATVTNADGGAKEACNNSYLGINNWRWSEVLTSSSAILSIVSPSLTELQIVGFVLTEEGARRNPIPFR